MHTLVLASNNAKKLAELQQLFAALPLQLKAQREWGVAEADEPHPSFFENALAKARHASRATGLPAIADDSGLCVDALGGAPGVIPAHFAALPEGAVAPGDREALRRAQDAANSTLLLQRLQPWPEPAQRSASFVCTLVALRHAEDPEPQIASARWSGTLLTAAQGEGGFGYDPLLFMPAQGCSVAQMGAELKNRHSHRAQAAERMVALLREVWHL